MDTDGSAPTTYLMNYIRKVKSWADPWRVGVGPDEEGAVRGGYECLVRSAR